MAARKTCRVCGQTMEATHENWITRKGKPEGHVCRACHSKKSRETKRQLVTLPTGEVVTRGSASNRKVRSTEEGRKKHNASSVECKLNRLKTDKWYATRQALAQETRRLLTIISNGGTPKDKTCFKLFGASLMDVVIHFNRQLDAKCLSWTDYKTSWCCDHIRPVALARSDVELKQLFLLENCQVLSMEEHAIKTLEDNALIREYEDEPEV